MPKKAKRKIAELHMRRLVENVSQVRRLIEIHTIVSGGGGGYKHKVEVLNKSSTVLLVACWEAYIEDLSIATFRYMLENAGRPEVFPNKVLALSSKELKESRNEIEVWKLAGKGWRKVLEDHKSIILKRFIGNFNTPRADQINQLFESLVGLKTLSSSWHWAGMSKERAQSKLNELITLRGSIAHRVKTSRSVTKGFVNYYIDFIYRLAIKSHNTVDNFIYSRTSKRPWGHFVYKKTG